MGSGIRCSGALARRLCSRRTFWMKGADGGQSGAEGGRKERKERKGRKQDLEY